MKKVGLTSLLILGSLSAIAQARLQVIHNSADAAASTVDVRVNGGFPDPSYDNLGFREATPFIDVAAGTYIVTLNAPNSMDANSPVLSRSLTLVDGETYIVMAAGIVSPSGYSPSSVAAPLDLFVKTGGLEVAGNPGDNDLLIFHGASDAPEVRISNVTNPLAVSDLLTGASFTDFSNYITVPNANYNIQVRTMDQTTVAEYSAPLQTLGAAGAAITVMASGFLNPSVNSNGEAFGLYAVLADGTVIALPAVSPVTTARLQVVHNCSATGAATVDVWVNGSILLLDDFAFRTASPFIDVPAATNLSIDICPPNSTNVSGSLYNQVINLTGGDKYVAVASGTIGAGTYTPATPFSITAFGGARESAAIAGKVDVKVFHGATDAPAVDVREVAIPAGVIVPNIAYGQNQGYLSLDPLAYILNIEAGGNVVQSYDANLTSLANAAVTVFASGFLNPAVNNNGEAFGLWVSTPAGGALLELPVSALASIDANTLINQVVYPNPVNDVLFFKGSGSNFEVRDLQGRLMVAGALNGTQSAIDVASLSNGNYLLVVDGVTTIKFQK